LTITLSTSDQATGGTYAVVVTNPAPGGGASNSVSFTVNNAVPTITSLSPTSTAAGAAAQTLAIKGTNFLPTSTVTYNGVAHTPAFASSTQLKITLSTSDQATPGTYGVAVTNPAPGGGASSSVNFTVTASRAAVALTPTSIAFANQTVGTSSSARTVTLSNPGTAALSISSITLTGTNPGAFRTTTTCGSSLSAGASCTISVTFVPASSSSRTASLTVTDNAAGGPQSVSLTGTGVAATPAANLSLPTIAFGNQTVGTTSRAQTVTLSNPGNAALSITGIAITGTNPAAFTVSSKTCGSTVNAGAGCTISVVFTPHGAGSKSASVAITDNAPGSPQSVSLTGTGK